MSLSSLKYGIIYNPISGQGKGKKYVDQIEQYFSSRGEEVLVKESSPEGVDQEFLKNISGLIVVGGDGTIRPYLPFLAMRQIPVILFPAGNESLIAKQFLVERDISKLFERVKKNKPTMHYYGLANGEPFFLMCSVGFDAEVVHWVKRNRKSFSSDILYLKGVLASLFKTPNSYKLVFNNKVNSIFGTVIVANSPFYGGDIQPVQDADSRDRKLSVRCFTGGYLKLIFRFLLMRMGLDQYEISDRWEGQIIEMESVSGEPFRYQIDGEAMLAEGGLKIESSGKSVGFY